MPRLINQHPGRSGALALGALPFLLIVAAYVIGSDLRLTENPNDKLLPSFAAFGAAIEKVAFLPDARSGEILLWKDTASSLLRLLSGIFISAALALAAGILIGVIPRVRAAFAPLVAVLSLIPPLAILPILFIVFGLGEVSKIILIVIGITPFLIRDLALRTGEIPPEQLIKAQTLGASTWLVILRVVLPQILPRLIDAVRLSLGAAWLFLIAAEAIAATDGLGYRIFLVRRYLAMDLILPYVAWITLLAYAFDLMLRRLSRRLFPWYHAEIPRA
ncbi:MAG: ABC transporter permease subunit [Gammaproteobacteria bacterium]|nr:ABC transporter permease subunit [Gammaproteobacteria bacterium]